MSLARALFNDFRPLFRLLEEPFGSGAMYPTVSRFHGRPLDHPFFRVGNSIQPSVDLSEEGNSYLVEAELPGVKKENIQVHIGDNGQSVTIKGSINARSQSAQNGNGDSGNVDNGSTSGTKEVSTESSPAPLSTERHFAGSSLFTRTLWLPRKVDESKVTAKLEDGILTLRIPKAEDKGSVQINVE